MSFAIDVLGDLDDETVVVVGLGPVGSVAALDLAKRGLTVVALDAALVPSDDPAESRASTFHPPTLEMLDALGVTAALLPTGLVASTYQYRDRRAGVVAEFDLAALADDTPYPYRLQTEQSNLVRIIRDQLEAMDNVRLVVGASVEAVSPAGSRTLLMLNQGGVRREISAAWVIAADGSNSVIRRGLGIEFVGMTYPERFLVASTTTELADLIPGIAYVNYVSDPEEWLVLLRTPRHWRVLFPVADTDDDAALLDPIAIEKRLQGVVSYEPGFELSHATLYNVHQRVAETFRVGHTLLVGDAAHINNPLGGMGMNSGIHDATAAAAAISAALDGDPEALDRYAADRRRVALDYVQQATHRNYQIMQERDPVLREAHHADLRAQSEDPERSRAYLLNSSMLSSARQ